MSGECMRYIVFDPDNVDIDFSFTTGQVKEGGRTLGTGRVLRSHFRTGRTQAFRGCTAHHGPSRT